MGNAYKCDRCGNFGEGGPENIIKTDVQIIEMCGDCSDKFDEFMDKNNTILP